MKGDNSRDTFRREKHFRNVRMQQGRVQIDADWNELADIYDNLLAGAAGDIMRPALATGIPAPTIASPTPTSGVGALGINLGGTGGNTNLTINPGRFYVDGIVGELNPPATGSTYLFTAQSDFPGATLPAASAFGTYIVYADVWQRHITAVEDPSIREVALGGPDTATRSQTLTQVKMFQAPTSGTCATSFPTFDQFTKPTSPPQGTLAAQAIAPTTASTPCDVGNGGGFTGLQNQLYRVEIHQAGTFAGVAGAVSFKWSRDNGSVLSALSPTAAAPSGVNNIIVLQSAPPDDAHGFSIGQWVELTDDTIDMQGRAGVLVKLTKIDGVNLTYDSSQIKNPDGTSVPSTSTTPLVDLTAHPKARRWDQTDAAGVTSLVPTVNGFVPLENGVLVQFTNGVYRAGDYWLIPARTAIGSASGVDWPLVGGVPQAQTPKGITHHYARLALVDFVSPGIFQNLQDCRKRLPVLSTLSSDDIAFTNLSNLVVPPTLPPTVTGALQVLSNRTNPPPKVRASVVASNTFTLPANTGTASVFTQVNAMILSGVVLSNTDASGRVPVLVRFFMGGINPTRGGNAALIEADLEFQLIVTPSTGSAIVIAQSLEVMLAGNTTPVPNFEIRHAYLERMLVGAPGTGQAIGGLLPGTYTFSASWSVKSPIAPWPSVQACVLGGLAPSAPTTRELMVMEL